MSLWLLACRNGWRNRRRSLLTGGIVGFGFAALTLAAGFMAQSFDALRTGTIRGGVGHLQFASPAFFAGGEAGTLEHGLMEGDRLVERLSVDPEVQAVLRRIDFFGLVGVADRAVPFVGAGLEPEAEAATMDAANLLTAGRWLSTGTAHEVILGAGLAASVGAEPGSVVTAFAMTVDGVLNALDLEVVGIAALPVRELDDRYLALPIDAADELLAADGRVSKLVVLISEAERAAAVGERLRRSLAAAGDEIAVRTWQDLAVFYRQVRHLYLGIFGFLGSVLVVIVFLAAANSMLMATTERTREIGTLRALGMRPRWVVRLFVLEGLAITGGGCSAGTVVSLVLREAVNRAHLVLPPPPGVAHPVELSIRFYPGAYLLAAAGMLLAGLVATWIAARRAARRPIIEALAHV